MARTTRRFITLFLLLSSSAASAERGTIRIQVVGEMPRLEASARLSEPSGNNVLDAGESGTLYLSVENKGKGDAFDVRGEITADKSVAGLSFTRTFSFRTIPAGAAVTQEISLKAAGEIATDRVVLDVTIKEANGFQPAPVRVALETRALSLPRLAVADYDVGDAEGPGKIAPMKIVTVSVRVRNGGDGEARGVVAEVRPGADVFVAGDGARAFALGAIPAGGQKDFKVSIYTNSRIAAGQPVPLSVSLRDEKGLYGGSFPLALTMDAEGSRGQEVVVSPEPRPEEGFPGAAARTAAPGFSVDIEKDIPSGATAAGKYDVAAIIGNRNYSSRTGTPDVDFALRDARLMKEYAVRTLGYDPANIIYVEDAGAAKFLEIFGAAGNEKSGKLYQWVKKDVSRLFVYYVGHGAPDLDSGEAYFVPVDASPQYIKSTGYPLKTFYENLSRIPARQKIVVIDACFSGTAASGFLFRNISPAMVKVKKEYAAPSNAVLFTSGSLNQVSTWYPEMRHSLFTYYFLKGLQGDAPRKNPKTLTLEELRSYLEENVPYMARRLNGIEQNPMIVGPGTEEIAVYK